MHRAVGWVVLLVGLWPQQAAAQFYIQTDTPGSFVPLEDIPGIQNVTPVAFSAPDDGTAQVVLPFTYTFLGVPKNAATISTNGFVGFEDDVNSSNSNTVIGQAGAPNEMIAVWWDDLVLPGADGFASTGELGSAPNRIFVIEVREFERFSFSGLREGHFQVWLYEGPSGAFEVHYGGVLGESYSATAGFEGAGGTPNGTFGACTDSICGPNEYAGLVGRIWRVERVEGIELTGSVLDFGRGARPGATTNVPIAISNLGSDPVGLVQSTLHLSLDGLLDPSDVEIGSVSVPSVAAGGGTTSRTATVTVPPATPSADYTVLLNVDAPGDIDEIQEVNNVVAAPTRFATAFDLGAQEVRPAPSVPVQGALAFELDVNNLGLPYAGGFSTTVRASVDQLADAGDLVLGTVASAASGATTETLELTVDLPANVSPGAYYAIAVVDEAEQLDEYERANNVVASAARFLVGPDLSPTAIVAPPGAEAGQAAAFDVTIENAGAPYAGQVSVRLRASADAILDQNDPLLGDATATLTGLSSESVSVVITMPVLSAGSYFPIALVDFDGQVAEADEGNNGLLVQTPFFIGPNLSISGVTHPAEIPEGQTVSFVTTVASLGAPFVGSVDYDLYASTDAIWDAGDVRLGAFTVDLAGQAEIADARLIVFPQAPPGDLTLIARVDPARVIAEADEGDNLYVDVDAIETGPDFRPSSIDFDPADVAPGDFVQVTARINNDGVAYSGPVDWHAAISTDSTLSPDDFVFLRSVGTFAGEGSIVVTASVAVSSFVPPVRPGAYDILVEVDPDDRVLEQQEDDNDDDAFSTFDVLGPDLVALTVESDNRAFVGQPFAVSFGAQNPEAFDAGPFEAVGYLSDDGIILQGVEIFRFPVGGLVAGGSGTWEATAEIPAGLPPGRYALGVHFDGEDVVAERDENNNVAARDGSVEVIASVPDLTGQLTQTPTAAIAASAVAVAVRLENQGVADATAFDYAVVLSADDQLDPEDRTLRTLTSSLAVGGARTETFYVNLPLNVLPGDYRLGLLLDPSGQTPEVDEGNNASFSPPFPIVAPGLYISVDALFPALLGRPYDVTIGALGGDGTPRRWSLVSGVLPPGIALDAATGELAGTPSQPGTFGFLLRVEDDSGASERWLELVVLAEATVLELVEAPLPTGQFGVAYDARLVAVGGQPPYQFSSLSSLPAGLTLAESGLFSGVPADIGDFLLEVRVTDQQGAEDLATVVLSVVDPENRVLVRPLELPEAELGVPYCGDGEVVVLPVVGGAPPYAWSITEGSVPGLSVQPNGTFCGTPTELGTFSFTARAEDSVGAFDIGRFDVLVVPRSTVEIVTATLADGRPGVAYSANLVAAAGVLPYEWSLRSGSLPPGLQLFVDGRIAGVPDTLGLWTFGVEVQDGDGRTAQGELSIRIVEDASVQPGGGCGCDAQAEGGRSWWSGLVVCLLGALWRARPKRRRLK